ncbi:SDR family NAD(P)-dependent oxidoreductase [Leptolyngbya sp. CCNP1308]|uniref:type I polyketide synthase n=1 Tax=Leptolyngbya sp. CCNP1308 TaxID=3110255 RepID=UPI002B20D449|nr:SDR family NAD(P)-dependent oxidoreductase [Leptolyngbya sp. CCNP1308]MEA5452795.1 SDR family NAD(P)-dependent oxidoreductase [Leptolyngbya sp. CCNP1308]
MTTHYTGLEIAVVGMAGRFPGSPTLADFWHNLQNGVDAVSHFSEAELLAAGIEAATLKQPNYVKARAILEQADEFDAGFFGLSPRDAEILDPQQRVFLETAWAALETAGYDPQRFAGAIGVYGGATLSGYLFNLFSQPELMQTVGQFPLVLGNGREFLTTRTSYLMNLRGPSVNVQTACSTALVAVHLAGQALLSGECDLALAGGVSIRLPLKGGYLYQEGGISSPDGRCRAFDARAQGTVGGSGVGLLVLKRLEDALGDRDTIHGVIKGSAINNDGADKISYTAPRIEGQADVIRAAQQVAEVAPESIQVIEAHGTGTILGDPIEVAALTQAFQTTQRGYCALGSVKTNIGHLDAAAGAAGLIKTLLALQQRQIPPSLHFEAANPQIDFEHSPFYVNTQLRPWPAPPHGPRRAGVSSFGIGGTNAHVIVEEAPPAPVTSESRPWQLLLWSAKTAMALETATQNLAEALEPDGVDLADVAYTLQVGRQAFAQRRMAVCCDRTDALTALTAAAPHRVKSQTAPDSAPQVVFLLPGQGAQQVGMGRQLYETEPTFRDWIDRGADLLHPHLGLDLRQILYPDDGQQAAALELIHRTDIAQPGLFLLEYALAQLWRQWGITPQALIGHSLGEYVAACLAGVAELEILLPLVALRGKLMAQQPEGAMLSVAQSAERVMSDLPADLVLAADNAPELCVVAGSVDAIAHYQQQLETQNIPCRRLKTSHAFHSPLMAGAVAPFRQALSELNLQPPQIPWVSNLTGTWITPEQAIDPDYWVQHLRQPVQFRTGLQTLSEAQALLLEVGPGQTLTTLARQHPALKALTKIPSLSHPRDAQDDGACLLSALGQLWLANVAIDWPGFYAHERPRRVPLPTYPFERQRYWVEAQQTAPVAQITLQKKSDIADWFYLPSWRRSPLCPPVNVPTAEASWLLFLDDSPLAQAMVQQFPTAVWVRSGECFSRLDDQTFTLTPQRPEDYRALLNALGTHRPTQILHGWSLTSPADFAEIQERGCQSLLHLAQALAQCGWHHALRLTVMTPGIFNVTGNETLLPAHATLLGPSTVIPQEYRQITCRVVDWPVTLNDGVPLDRLLADLTTPDAEAVIAHRHGLRWVQQFEPLPLPEPASDQTLLRSQGVYLITGGLGNIGLTLAATLAPWQARIALLSRREFPPRSHWPTWLASTPDDPISDKIRQVQAIEAAGAEVLLLTADVGDSAQLQGAIAQTEAHFGPLNGVVHAAGALGEQAFQVIAETGSTELAQQFQAKVVGLENLAEVLQGKPLDFCLLCSSLASVLGGLGFAAYGAANYFMDAFAQQQSRTATFPWLSVNWDGWRFRPDERQGLGQSMADLALTPAEGSAVWQRLLAYAVAPQVIVSTGDLNLRQQQWQPSTPPLSEPAAVTIHHDRPTLADDYRAPRDSVENAIAEIWQSFLGISPIGVDDSFFELGGHSLLATQIMVHLRQQFQVDIPLRCLFDSPTVAGLAQAIARIQSESTTDQSLTIAALPRFEPAEIQRLLDQIDQLPAAQVDDLLHQFSQLQVLT